MGEGSGIVSTHIKENTANRSSDQLLNLHRNGVALRRHPRASRAPRFVIRLETCGSLRQEKIHRVNYALSLSTTRHSSTQPLLQDLFRKVINAD